MSATHSKKNFRYAAAIVGASITYYFLGSLIIAWLPYASVPPQWLAHGLSPFTAVIAWFQLLNVLACLAAAIPIAIVIIWASPRFRLLFTFAVSTITATVVVGRVFDSDMSPQDHPSMPYWINLTVLFLAFLFSVPLAVSMISAAKGRLGRAAHV